MITKRQMGLAMPEALKSGRLETWYNPLVDAMVGRFITTPDRICFFLANLAEETGQLQALEENLHYSGTRLMQVFPSLFSSQEQADELAAHGPEAIANYIYADANRPKGYRMGNTEPGDGWKYRGRGPGMLTGHDNYARFFAHEGLDPGTNPDLLLTPKFGALAATGFWSDHDLNLYADRNDFDGCVQVYNGGTNGIGIRRDYLKRFRAAILQPDPVVAPVVTSLPPLPPQFIAPPLPQEPPPVTVEELKPVIEPVPPMPPVPPPGYSVQPSGNVVRDNIEDSTIVKASKIGQTVTVVAGAAGAAAGVATQLKGIFGEVSDVGAICLATVAIACLITAFFYFHKSKADRIEMNVKGIA